MGGGGEVLKDIKRYFETKKMFFFFFLLLDMAAGCNLSFFLFLKDNIFKIRKDKAYGKERQKKKDDVERRMGGGRYKIDKTIVSVHLSVSRFLKEK